MFGNKHSYKLFYELKGKCGHKRLGSKPNLIQISGFALLET